VTVWQAAQMHSTQLQLVDNAHQVQCIAVSSVVNRGAQKRGGFK